MPTVMGKYPPGTGTPEQKKLMDAIEAIQSDTGIKIPIRWMSLSWRPPGRETVTHQQLCEYMDRQISKAVLGQTATTEGTPGKLGNENSQEEAKHEIVEADADLLDACLNETLIRWIVDYNFPGVTEYPKLKTFAAPKPDLKQQSEIDKTLAVDIGLPIGTAYFYETYGIPAPEDGEKLVNPAPKAPPIGAPGGIPGAAQPPQFAERNAPPDNADRIAARLGADAMPATDALMAPLKKLVDTAGSLQAVRDSVINLYGEMDPADLGVIIARAMTIAEMTGRFEVAEETGKKKRP